MILKRQDELRENKFNIATEIFKNTSDVLNETTGPNFYTPRRKMINIGIPDEEKEKIHHHYLKYIDKKKEIQRERDVDIEKITNDNALPEADKIKRIGLTKKFYARKIKLAYKNLYYKYTARYNKCIKDYKENNRELLNEKAKEYYANNREDRLAYKQGRK